MENDTGVDCHYIEIARQW